MHTKLLARIGSHFCIQYHDIVKIFDQTRCIDSVMDYAIERYRAMQPKEKLIYYLEYGHNVRISGKFDMQILEDMPYVFFREKTMGQALYMSRNFPNAVLVITGHLSYYLICNKRVIIFSESQISGFKHVAF